MLDNICWWADYCVGFVLLDMSPFRSDGLWSDLSLFLSKRLLVGHESVETVASFHL